MQVATFVQSFFRRQVGSGTFWQCGGSGMFIPDPEFTHPGYRIPDLGSRILDSKTATKERGEKKFDVIPFYVATNFTNLYIILVLKC